MKKLTIAQLLEIIEGHKKPKKFWVDSNGKRHPISGAVSSKIVGGFEKTTTGSRRYLHGEAVYYKV